jgi:two-component sensor histidine kinase
VGKNDYELFHLEKADVLRSEDNHILATLESYRTPEQSVDRQGNRLSIDKHKVPILDDSKQVIGIIGLSFDITPLKVREEQLRASLREKETLLREINHRVKNNLQIVSSLLNLQLQSITDEKARALLQESRNRIYSMATIHELLYRRSEMETVAVKDYIDEITRYLMEVYELSFTTITIEKEIDDIELDMDEAIPVGLIITELVSNSIKYAFPETQEGTIFISLKVHENSVELVVRDNGVGMPETVLAREGHSLGLLLVQALVDQLQGTFSVDNRDGAYFSVVFTV